MPRRMANAEFRNHQWLHRFDDHIAPLNRLVDELCNGGKVPYIAPIYGGINAKLLSILRDPGPKTQLEDNGSGFLCLENNDATAEKMCELIAEAGIDVSEMVPWDYPPYRSAIHGGTDQSAQEGIFEVFSMKHPSYVEGGREQAYVANLKIIESRLT